MITTFMYSVGLIKIIDEGANKELIIRGIRIENKISWKKRKIVVGLYSNIEGITEPLALSFTEKPGQVEFIPDESICINEFKTIKEEISNELACEAFQLELFHHENILCLV